MINSDLLFGRRVGRTATTSGQCPKFSLLRQATLLNISLFIVRRTVKLIILQFAQRAEYTSYGQIYDGLYVGVSVSCKHDAVLAAVYQKYVIHH